MSAASVLETSRSETRAAASWTVWSRAGIEIGAVGADQVAIGREAFRTFGGTAIRRA